MLVVVVVVIIDDVGDRSVRVVIVVVVVVVAVVVVAGIDGVERRRRRVESRCWHGGRRRGKRGRRGGGSCKGGRKERKVERKMSLMRYRNKINAVLYGIGLRVTGKKQEKAREQAFFLLPQAGNSCSRTNNLSLNARLLSIIGFYYSSALSTVG